MVTVPEVIPAKPIVPVEAPATPMTGVTVILGTPEPLAFKIPPLVVARPEITLAADEYRSSLIVVVAG